ncbi:hypothetical protein [Flavobacterium sp. AG291]|uniref:hypothetical protein n=1 Tax=Flavobacterium sp. AG291 TaxID=2184000 RepID=UPI000E0A4D8E|nr:hypothetical protein [Flavobacterium sp. AG291]RDI07065.1 hypothetical protein DEU42_113165 [Flavobacterium sp. AG291]
MRNKETRTIAELDLTAAIPGYQPEQLSKQNANITQNDNVVKAFLPSVKDEAFAMTMDNYRRAVSIYNKKVAEANHLIDKHNASVQIYKEKNKLAEYQQQILINFVLRFADKNNWEFNEEVDKAGDLYSRFIAKRRIQKIKPFTEQVFQHILYLYNRQLMRRNKQREHFAQQELRPIQPLEINAWQVTTIKRDNDIMSLPICNKTVRNHRARLQEAGILIDKVYCGPKRGVKTHISPSILVIFDLHTDEFACAENQLLSLSKRKVLPNSKESTGTSLSEYKKRESATPDSDRKVLPLATALCDKNVLDKNTGGNEENQTEGAAAENVKVSETMSDKLRALIMHPQDLAIKLASGHFIDYIPIDKRLLFQEAYNGTLTRHEYRELILQDFFKSAAKLYRFSNAYIGSWKNAINLYQNYKWLTKDNIPFNKYVVYEDITQLRWRLEDARKWFARPNVKVSVSFPSVYFDFTRKNKKEIGFEYTSKRWERHSKYMAEMPLKKRKTERKAAERLEKINNSKKYENAIGLFMKNKKDFHWLVDYVENNLPIQYYNSLRGTLESLRNLKPNYNL